MFERVAGRPFDVHHVPVEALIAQQESATDLVVQSIAGLMRGYAKGDAIDMASIFRDFPIG